VSTFFRTHRELLERVTVSVRERVFSTPRPSPFFFPIATYMCVLVCVRFVDDDDLVKYGTPQAVTPSPASAVVLRAKSVSLGGRYYTILLTPLLKRTWIFGVESGTPGNMLALWCKTFSLPIMLPDS